jgi:hypothetical protein
VSIPSVNRWLKIATTLTWVASISTTAYYISLSYAWVEGAKFMWGYNGVLTILVGGALRIVIHGEDKKLLSNLSTLHLITGISLIFLALVVMHAPVQLQ